VLILKRLALDCMGLLDALGEEPERLSLGANRGTGGLVPIVPILGNKKAAARLPHSIVSPANIVA
jgi:hypothetical protein